MIKLLFVVLLFTCAAQAQNQDKFWSKQRFAWTAAHAATASFDHWTTRRGLNTGGVEANPLVRPFVEAGGKGQIASVSLSLLFDLGLSYVYHRMGLKKLKVIFPATFTIAHLTAGSYNYGLVNGRR